MYLHTDKGLRRLRYFIYSFLPQSRLWYNIAETCVESLKTVLLFSQSENTNVAKKL